jgi:hypothetical protein
VGRPFFIRPQDERRQQQASAWCLLELDHPTALFTLQIQESIMMRTRSYVLRAWVPLALAVASPLAAHAQETVLGRWSGRVDKEMQLTIRGNNVSSNTLSGQQLNGRFRLATPLPSQDGTVRVAVERGRGTVSVVQQPSSANGYTAIIRMLDRGSGADVYRVVAYWTPTNMGRGNRGYGRGRGNMGQGVGRGNNRINNAATLRWTGDVDSDAEIRWGANGVTQRNIGGNGLRAARSSLGGGGYVQGGTVSVTAQAGRGSVQVVQQPSAANGWTTVIRVHDPQPGYGHYDFSATWQ